MAHVWIFAWMGMSKTAPTIGTHPLEAPGPAARLICSPTMVTMRTSWGFANSEPTRPFVGFGWLWRLAWSLQNSILHHSSILEIYLKFVIEDVSRKLQAIHKMSWANPALYDLKVRLVSRGQSPNAATSYCRRTDYTWWRRGSTPKVENSNDSGEKRSTAGTFVAEAFWTIYTSIYACKSLTYGEI